MPIIEIPEILINLQEHLFSLLAFEIKELSAEKESQEYAAHTFSLNEHRIVFRNAKITPTKVGQFVTIWKRNEKGITQPYEVMDSFDFMIICANCGDHSGVFIFPKQILLQQGIILGNNSKGKRGIRVYPSWDTALNKQAEKTQLWQLDYFVTITPENITDIDKARRILSVPKL